MKPKALPTKVILMTINRIMNQKPNFVVIFNKRIQDLETVSAIHFLEQLGLIFNFREMKEDSDDFYKYKKGDMVFGVSNWDALWSYYLEQYEYGVIDPYGKEKQIRKVKEVILKKYDELENSNLILRASDFGDFRKHIYIIPALEKLEEEGFLSIEDWSFPSFADLECNIKLHKIIDTENEKEIDTSKKSDLKNEENRNDKNLLLYKDKNGNYFYNNLKISIQINTIYFKVFDIIYSHCDQSGFILYEDIEKKLVDNSDLEEASLVARNKRINNSISNTQGFFKYAKINEHRMENKTLDNKKLLEIIRGKGVKLNNSKIK